MTTTVIPNNRCDDCKLPVTSMGRCPRCQRRLCRWCYFISGSRSTEKIDLKCCKRCAQGVQL